VAYFFGPPCIYMYMVYLQYRIYIACCLVVGLWLDLVCTNICITLRCHWQTAVPISRLPSAAGPVFCMNTVRRQLRWPGTLRTQTQLVNTVLTDSCASAVRPPQPRRAPCRLPACCRKGLVFHSLRITVCTGQHSVTRPIWAGTRRFRFATVKVVVDLTVVRFVRSSTSLIAIYCASSLAKDQGNWQSVWTVDTVNWLVD